MKIALNIKKGKVLLVEVNDIILFEKCDKYIKIILCNSSIEYMKMSMKNLTEFLDNKNLNLRFYKPHCSFIININYIKCIYSKSIKMSNKLVVPISNRKNNDFMNKIKENTLELK